MSFGANMQKWADKTNKKIESVIREVCLELTFTVATKRSPVGDPTYWKYPDLAPPGYVGGRFRNNWYPAINTPDPTTNDIPDRTGMSAMSRAGAMVHQAPGNIFYLTNSLPYSIRIENGWSRSQAPQGVVKLSVMDFKSQLAKAVRGAK